MIVEEKTTHQLNHEALHVLYEHIGVTNTIRFINQFSQGQGDYTQERTKLFEGKSRDEIMKGIRAMD